MKHNPDFRDPTHRENLDTVVNSIVQGKPLHTGNLNKTLFEGHELPSRMVATELFGIPRHKLTDEAVTTAENLLRYIAKRHTHTISKTLGRKTYQTYMKQGHTVYPHDPSVALEEADFSSAHELPHYLISWLLNSSHGINSNSTVPSYVREYTNKTTELDIDGVRRDYLEEVYAQVIDYESEGGSSLITEFAECKRLSQSFEAALITLVERWLVAERDNIITYEQGEVSQEKVEEDYSLCKERLYEIVTCSQEERDILRHKYPVECFVYDVCHALYFDMRNDPYAVFNVYQSYFRVLFAKANANPYIHKEGNHPKYR